MRLLLRSFGQFLNNTMVTLTWCSFGFTLRIPKHLYRQLVRVIIPFVLPSFRNGLQIINKKKKKKKRRKDPKTQIVCLVNYCKRTIKMCIFQYKGILRFHVAPQELQLQNATNAKGERKFLLSPSVGVFLFFLLPWYKPSSPIWVFSKSLLPSRFPQQNGSSYHWRTSAFSSHYK